MIQFFNEPRNRNSEIPASGFKITFLIAMLAIGGCSATGPKYSGQPVISTSTITRLIVYREDDLLFAAGSARVKIESKDLGYCDNAGFNRFEVNPGDHVLSVDTKMSPGECDIKFRGQPGEELFFKIEPRSEAFFASAALGLIGTAADTMTNQCSGSWWIHSVEESTAVNELKNLKETQ